MPEATQAYPVPEPITLVYSIVDGLKLQCDIYLPPPSSFPREDKGRPAVLYWHGGGLLCGDRTTWFPQWLVHLCLQKGVIFISCDYRLLLPCTGHHILADALAAFEFFQSARGREALLAEEGNRGGLFVDEDRVAAAGTSAGGYIAYLAAAHLGRGRVMAMLGMYAMGGDFLTPHYLTRKTKPFLNNRPLLGPELFAPLLTPSPDDPPLHPIAGSKLEFDETGFPKDPRVLVSRYGLQEAVWLDWLTGEEGFSDRLRGAYKEQEGRVSAFEDGANIIGATHLPLFPQFHPLDDFPPTLLVHGTEDTAVPIAESKTMAELLRVAKARTLGNGDGGWGRQEVKTLWMEGRSHSFDFHEKGWEGEVLPAVEEWLNCLVESRSSPPQPLQDEQRGETVQVPAKGCVGNSWDGRSRNLARKSHEKAIASGKRDYGEVEVVRT